MRLRALLLIAALPLACFPHQAGPRLAHFASTAPGPGGSAPDLRLLDLEGRERSLRELLGSRPVVVQLGSYSCPVFRYRRFGMEELRERFGDRVAFVVVYTQEAHPVGAPGPYDEEEWNPWINRLVGVQVDQPGSVPERLERARFTRDRLELGAVVLVDRLDNRAWRSWGAASAPAFVLDETGEVVLRQVWVDPKEIEKALEELLD